jgi:hypothetical protein
MTASDHINPQQLRMLMTAEDIYHDVDSFLDQAGGSVVDMIERKQQRAQTYAHPNAPSGPELPSAQSPKTLDQAVGDNDISEPVTLGHYGDTTILQDGHHRWAAALNHPSVYLPVQHVDRIDSGCGGGGCCEGCG